ncbi:VWA domain-containing protein [Cesiribacter sp. SM1]|uniref:vWA domain-containing protein n=1 Tax=Cesiribacter sp. SM1 TaxID=2861196 RepID=UPI001CD608FC|nr:VWA domain-containing protein [Cesiribacter sp. SM1]
MKKNLLFLCVALLLFTISCHEDSGDIGIYFNGEFTGGERYNDFEENPFVAVADQPVSTFSVDADGASYSNVRRFLSMNQLPPKAAVRTEELINYFTFDYPEATDGSPISVNGEVSACPWNDAHKLIRIGLKGTDIPEEQLPPSNLVFLIDVSGSMTGEDRLDLLKKGFTLFTDQLKAHDQVSVVTYAGSAGVVLPATSGADKTRIKQAIQSLGVGGSTAGAQGIVTAYEIAKEHFIEGGNNRVILATDGDFNVGVSSQDELVKLIESKRDEGIFLTVLGVGAGNLNEGMMEQVANHGNGNYEYLDNLDQVEKVFIQEFSKFFTVAKDVKVQLTFNPELVESYRLIGYENRKLESEEFEDDTKDAGEIGAGQTITALYEIKPKPAPNIRAVPTFTIDFRYKEPSSDVSNPLKLEIFDEGNLFEASSAEMQFAASVAAYAMLLRESAYLGSADYHQVKQWAADATHNNQDLWKQEFIQLIDKAASFE